MTSESIPLIGYLDRFSHRPGETFTAYVHSAQKGECQVKLVRVISGDPNPNGPGLRFEDLNARLDRGFIAGPQETHPGSYGIVGNLSSDPATPRTWTVLVQSGALRSVSTVLSEEAGDVKATLRVGRNGAEFTLDWPGGRSCLSTKTPMREREWYRVWASADPSTGEVIVGQQHLDETSSNAARERAEGLRLPAHSRVVIAAEGAHAPHNHFTGKLEDPAILRGGFQSWPDPGVALDQLAPQLVAGWDFSQEIASQAIVDVGPDARHGKLVNYPGRAMVGVRWSGNEHCWRHAPRDYAAISFHDDDLDDCRWGESFRWTVPDDLKSGCYAFHLSSGTAEDWVPFYVLPRRTGPFAPVVFLAPTFTYQAYANHARGSTDQEYLKRVEAWGAYPHNPDQYDTFAHSTYDRHRDNSGVSFTSRRRPILTMRPGFLTFVDQQGSGLRHYPADTHLLAWLEAKGIAFDVITDEDLDEEGVALLEPYRVVLTGSHPEYHTENTLDALTAFTRRGQGRLVYLGGNGFYWRIARDRTTPHLFELRRAEGGIRAWEAQPGEYYHQLDGRLGGLWRRARRPPQLLAGVGFSGQGLFEGTHYRVLPAARRSDLAWIFEGIEGDILGDYGLSGGGAAGFEMDRADILLGTPPDAVVLARSEDPPPSFVAVPEELLTHTKTVTGENVDELMRAEIVYFETRSGGAVFSVGSITFCGSLWQDGAFGGPVSRLLENIVRRFAQ
jgi:N,N-dimethylformamidase